MTGWITESNNVLIQFEKLFRYLTDQQRQYADVLTATIDFDCMY